MSKGKKFLLCLVILIGLTVLAPMILFNSQANILSLPTMKLTYSLFIAPALNMYLFWASVVLFVLLIVLFFVILFFPKKEKEIVVKEANGELKIEQKSIESYVAANVERAQFIDQPKIKVQMTKNKIDIKIIGHFENYDGIIPGTEQMMANIKEDIRRLLGVSGRSIDIVVDFVDYTEKDRKKSRVQ